MTAPLRRTRIGAREGVAAVALVLALTACSTIDDLFDDDSPAPAASSKPGSYPNLQSVPNRPDRPTPPAGLSGDRGNARYTDSDVKPVNETANAVVGQTLSASAPQAPAPGSVATAPATAPAVPPANNAVQSAPMPPPAATAPQSNAAPSPAATSPAAPSPVTPVASAPMTAPAPIAATGPVGMPTPIPPSATELILPSPSGSRAGAPIARAPGAVPTAVPVSGSLIEVAVVQFGRSSSGLDGTSLSVLRDVASIQRTQGGVVHVVGHASADSANADPQRAKEDAYGISLARANAIARQLAALGVPRDRIVVEAAADDQPQYAPVTATAVAANRRAEIYLDL